MPHGRVSRREIWNVSIWVKDQWRRPIHHSISIPSRKLWETWLVEDVVLHSCVQCLHEVCLFCVTVLVVGLLATVANRSLNSWYKRSIEGPIPDSHFPIHCQSKDPLSLFWVYLFLGRNKIVTPNWLVAYKNTEEITYSWRITMVDVFLCECTNAAFPASRNSVPCAVPKKYYIPSCDEERHAWPIRGGLEDRFCGPFSICMTFFPL